MFNTTNKQTKNKHKQTNNKSVNLGESQDGLVVKIALTLNQSRKRQFPFRLPENDVTTHSLLAAKKITTEQKITATANNNKQQQITQPPKKRFFIPSLLQNISTIMIAKYTNCIVFATMLSQASCFSTYAFTQQSLKSAGVNYHSHPLPFSSSFRVAVPSVVTKQHKSKNCFHSNGVSTTSSQVFASVSESDNSYFDDTEQTIIDAEIVDNHYKNIQHRKNKAIQGVHPIFQKTWSTVKSKLRKPSHQVATLFAAAVIMLSVLFTPLSAALAAPSAGRMGGSFGGGSSSRRSPTTSRSYSSPSRSSYNRGYSRGYSSGYYSRPSVTIAPRFGSGYGYYAPSPIYAPAGPGVIVARRGPSIIDIMLFGVFAYVMFNVFNNGGLGSLLDDNETMATSSALGKGVSVVQVSVALNVPQKNAPSSILTYLNRLSRTARTDSRVGVSNLVSQGMYILLYLIFMDCFVSVLF